MAFSKDVQFLLNYAGHTSKGSFELPFDLDSCVSFDKHESLRSNYMISRNHNPFFAWLYTIANVKPLQTPVVTEPVSSHFSSLRSGAGRLFSGFFSPNQLNQVSLVH